ncbi:phosphodiesterase [Pontibacillus halophilus JSM 076056 = DSM 19796]|uniref:Phosphoesterase n=1 Tax=Pontibacillus halophilus JSM 076056 = DSM 19796 TaxID=1385510 RepID=A0A0A5GH05_9BACI|nr:metallophosphoesterase [Pontibacillus halophilus]KGX91314.1 phosphodiesterase [Pontibacillus halophilus JSM 076056 = DSM 19796]
MKVIIIADTHLPSKTRGFPQILKQEMKDADYILHAGDWQTSDVYKEIISYAPTEGVYGNVDNESILELLPARHIVTIQGMKIGLVHGHGERGTTERRAIQAFQEEGIDMIIFGHSHIPMSRYHNGILLFNPGSPTYKRKLPYHSFGKMTVNEEGFMVEHVYFR